MDLIEYLKVFFTNPAIVLVGAVTLIEVAPIKINPWGRLFRWIGDIVNGDLRKELISLRKDFEQTKVDDMRWNILNFANRCRQGSRHSKDEWRHVISQISDYERYTTEKEIDNGVIEADSKYLRDIYIELCKKNDFL